MLAAKMKDFGQLKLRDITKVSGMKSPSAGEFIDGAVPVWAGCTQSAHPSHTRTEAKK